MRCGKIPAMAKRKTRKKATRTGSRLRRCEDALRKLALGYPETFEDSPWGERAIKVRKRVFLFMSRNRDYLALSVKLPESAADALDYPFAEPTHYGLGRHGWVSCRFEPGGDEPPMELIEEWIDESFRAIAPKKLIAQLDEPGEA